MRSAKQYNAFDHTFVVLAYEESPYLDECISSVVSQSVRGGNVRIATSSPCRYIDEAAEKYGIAVSENPVKGGGLISDFAFAYDTIAITKDMVESSYCKAFQTEDCDECSDSIVYVSQIRKPDLLSFCTFLQGQYPRKSVVKELQE